MAEQDLIIPLPVDTAIEDLEPYKKRAELAVEDVVEAVNRERGYVRWRTLPEHSYEIEDDQVRRIARLATDYFMGRRANRDREEREAHHEH